VKKAMIDEWTCLLHHAVTMGYSWNEAHTFLVEDEVCPMYESYTTDIYIGMGEHYGYSEDSGKVIDSFLKKEGLSEATLTR